MKRQSNSNIINRNIGRQANGINIGILRIIGISAIIIICIAAIGGSIRAIIDTAETAGHWNETQTMAWVWSPPEMEGTQSTKSCVWGGWEEHLDTPGLWEPESAENWNWVWGGPGGQQSELS